MTAKLNWHMLDIPGLEPLDFFSRATPAYPYYFPNYTVLYPPQQHESDPSKQPTKHVHFPAQLAVMLTNRKKWPFGGPCLFSWLATKTDYPSIGALRENRLKCFQQPIPSWRWRYKGGIVRCFRGMLEFVVSSVRTIPIKKTDTSFRVLPIHAGSAKYGIRSCDQILFVCSGGYLYRVWCDTWKTQNHPLEGEMNNGQWVLGRWKSKNTMDNSALQAKCKKILRG